MGPERGLDMSERKASEAVLQEPVTRVVYDSRPARAAGALKAAIRSEARAAEVCEVSLQADLLERAQALRAMAFKLRDECSRAVA
jgi:hypothetical protein